MDMTITRRVARPRRELNQRAADIFISAYVCTFILLIFIASSDLFLHWYVLPVLICGLLIGPDLVAWLRGRLDLFEPVGIIGAIGFHMFFLAPLLHVHWDFWLHSVEHPHDWRPWLGAMAILNVWGLILYRMARSFWRQFLDRQRITSIWTAAIPRYYIIIAIALIIAATVQIQVYTSFGGIGGFIAHYEQRFIDTETGGDAFRGFGWKFMISETFPLLLMMAFAVYAQPRKYLHGFPIILLIITIFFILQILFGGLRGSRSNTILALFWAVGIYHFMIRPVSRHFALVGVIFLMGFLFVYGLSDDLGRAGISSLWNDESHIVLEEETDQSFKKVLLRDLARSGIQAYLLYRVSRPETDYSYTWGRAYLGDLAIILPRSVWREFIGIERPQNRVYEGTEALYGKGTYVEDEFFTPNVFGLGGEALLSFGPPGTVLVYSIFGIIVATVSWLRRALPQNDIRLLFYPALIILCFNILIGDLINVVSFSMRDLTVPSLVIAMGFIYQKRTNR